MTVSREAKLFVRGRPVNGNCICVINRWYIIMSEIRAFRLAADDEHVWQIPRSLVDAILKPNAIKRNEQRKIAPLLERARDIGVDVSTACCCCCSISLPGCCSEWYLQQDIVYGIRTSELNYIHSLSKRNEFILDIVFGGGRVPSKIVNIVERPEPAEKMTGVAKTRYCVHLGRVSGENRVSHSVYIIPIFNRNS